MSCFSTFRIVVGSQIVPKYAEPRRCSVQVYLAVTVLTKCHRAGQELNVGESITSSIFACNLHVRQSYHSAFCSRVSEGEEVDVGMNAETVPIFRFVSDDEPCCTQASTDGGLTDG